MNGQDASCPFIFFLHKDFQHDDLGHDDLGEKDFLHKDFQHFLFLFRIHGIQCQIHHLPFDQQIPFMLGYKLGALPGKKILQIL
jgi:hypothetical protein